MNSSRIVENLDTLIKEGESVLKTTFDNGMSAHAFVDLEAYRGWSLNATALVRSMFGTDSDYYKRLAAITADPNYQVHAITIHSILKGVKTAWISGYVFDVKAMARADVEADLIDQATTLLDARYEIPATVVAGSVLEQHLRAIATSWGIATHNADGKALTLEPLNVELKRAGAYDGIMQKRITYLGSLRNDAAHGNWAAGREEQVRTMIRDVIDTCDRVNAR